MLFLAGDAVCRPSSPSPSSSSRAPASAPRAHRLARRRSPAQGRRERPVRRRPRGWTRIAVPGADSAYRDDANLGSVLFDVRCHDRDGDAPLGSLTEHLIMGTTARDVQREETLPFDGREALHTLMTAKLDGVPMQYDLYVMKKDGCVYDLVYVAPPDRFAAARRPSSASRPACTEAGHDPRAAAVRSPRRRARARRSRRPRRPRWGSSPTGWAASAASSSTWARLAP